MYESELFRCSYDTAAEQYLYVTGHCAAGVTASVNTARYGTACQVYIGITGHTGLITAAVDHIVKDSLIDGYRCTAVNSGYVTAAEHITRHDGVIGHNNRCVVTRGTLISAAKHIPCH